MAKKIIEKQSRTDVTAIGTLHFNKKLDSPKKEPLKDYGVNNQIEKINYGNKIIENVFDKATGKHVSQKTTIRAYVESKGTKMYLNIEDTNRFKENEVFYIYRKDKDSGTGKSESFDVKFAEDEKLINDKNIQFSLKTNINVAGVVKKSFVNSANVITLEQNAELLEGKRVRIEFTEKYNPSKDGDTIYTSIELKRVIEPFESDVDGINYKVQAYAKKGFIVIPEDMGTYVPSFPANLYVTVQQATDELNEQGKAVYENKLILASNKFRIDSCVGANDSSDEINDIYSAIDMMTYDNCILFGQNGEDIAMEDDIWYLVYLEGEYVSIKKDNDNIEEKEVEISAYHQLMIKQGKMKLEDIVRVKTTQTRDKVESYACLLPSIAIKDAIVNEEMENIVTINNMWKPNVSTANKKFEAPKTNAMPSMPN